MKVAFVHDWLTVYAGAERVLEAMLDLYPNADMFALCDFLDEDNRAFIKNKKVHTSFIQNLPYAKTKYRNYLSLMPLAIEQFDLSKYDLIISSSHAVSKGVITGPDQLHICMCYSPMRYAWDLTHQYLNESNLHKGLKNWIVRYMLHRLRLWDHRTSCGVDNFIAISDFIARRIHKTYGRESTIIYPPVDTNAFKLSFEKEDFYLTASRMVPYKKIDLIVEAFSNMPDKKLIVIGEGPDFNKIEAKAGANVTLLGYQPFNVLKDHMQRAKAFVFAAEEDFGIIPIEAQACGTPVIAYGKGGALETIIADKTGVFFYSQDKDAIIQAVQKFEGFGSFDCNTIHNNALRFSAERFKTEFKDFVEKTMNTHYSKVNYKKENQLEKI